MGFISLDSTNWRIDFNWSVESGDAKPADTEGQTIVFISLYFCLAVLAITSSTVLNRSGDNRHPCLVLFCFVNNRFIEIQFTYHTIHPLKCTTQ